MIILKEKKREQLPEKYTNFLRAVHGSVASATLKTLNDVSARNANTTMFQESGGNFGVYLAGILGVEDALMTFYTNHILKFRDNNDRELQKLHRLLDEARAETLRIIRS